MTFPATMVTVTGFRWIGNGVAPGITFSTYIPGARLTLKRPLSSVVAVATTFPSVLSTETWRFGTGLGRQGRSDVSTGQEGADTTVPFSVPSLALPLPAAWVAVAGGELWVDVFVT